ncbi:class I SAM-dependent methyltransferase [Noviherbaspirillum sedimenti]|uniref:Class I SAM-dependent methyltransferase n=1 Tax=Noviherbaspirillum sedimenti TaxID=2320865 RepID=A0A3A3G4I8_9BURK|nr:class I SAM-dependent methyltransferase [Noviherbaspirillum sedimenti]RJG02754.1 class I SAM-dependent methyltransferase [Noviherbaspirillum sedimenti]
MTIDARGGNLNEHAFVPETRFGIWFLGSETWLKHVLEVAIADLVRLIGKERRETYGTVVDVGCGQGKSFTLLKQRFNPQRLIGIDADPEILEVGRKRAQQDGVAVELMLGSGAAIALPDNSVDILFCHQTFHHLVEQEKAIAEFYRVLKPGGMLLFAESTRAYIHSWIIRLLFRHPMEVQKTAEEYLALIRWAGFEAQAERISYPYLWWSLSDLGLLNRLGIKKTPPFGQREETLLNLVAIKSQP